MFDIKAMLTAIVRWIAYRCHFGTRWWVWLPSAFALSFIYSTGPNIQKYLVALITSDETSIYGSSFQRTLVTLPKLGDWFQAAVSMPFPLVGLAVVFFGVRTPSIKQVFLKVALFGFLALLGADLIYAVLQDSLSVVGIFEDTVADFVGGVAAAAVYVGVLEIAEYAFASFDWPTSARRLIAGGLVVISGALALCGIFYITDFFYRPRPASISLMADAPTKGMLTTDPAKKAQRHVGPAKMEDLKPFSVLAQSSSVSGLTWRVSNNQRIDWSSSQEGMPYDVKLSLFSGCKSAEETHKLSVAESSFVVQNTRSFSLDYDWGVWYTTVGNLTDGAGFTFNGADAGYFAVDRNGDGKSFDLQQFVDSGAQVKLAPEAGSLELFVFPSPGQEKGQKPENPNLRYTVNGTEHVVGIRVLQNLKPYHVSECQALSAQKAFNEGIVDGDGAALISIRIDVSPHVEAGERSASNTALMIKGDGGWITAKGVDPKSMDSLIAERINMITIIGNLKSSDVNGVEVPIKEGDSYVALGDDLRGSFVSGLLKVSGEANLLWINSNRANQTKWESLPTEYKLAVLGGLSSAFLLIVRHVAQLTSRPDPMRWLEDGAVDRTKA